jgi:hypothetical protein
MATGGARESRLKSRPSGPHGRRTHGRPPTAIPRAIGRIGGRRQRNRRDGKRRGCRSLKRAKGSRLCRIVLRSNLDRSVIPTDHRIAKAFEQDLRRCHLNTTCPSASPRR